MVTKSAILACSSPFDSFTYVFQHHAHFKLPNKKVFFKFFKIFNWKLNQGLAFKYQIMTQLGVSIFLEVSQDNKLVMSL